MLESRLDNGTILAEYTITGITAASRGNYILQITNQAGTFRADIGISQVMPINSKLGSMEIMVIIIGLAIGLLLGVLVLGVYHKQKKLQVQRSQDEERQGLLADRDRYQ